MRPFARLALTATALALIVTAARAQPTRQPAAYLPLIAQPATETTAAPSPSSETASPAPSAETASPSPETPSPEPSSTPTLPPPDFVSCGVVGNPSRAPNYPVAIIEIDKGGETVTLRNVSAEAVNLTGWRMCSITGGQQHPISGTLAPGALQTFSGAGGPIWNNSNSDPGALWNAAGQLVSYWPD